MDIERKRKLNYETTDEIWAKVKLYAILGKKENIHLALDDLIERGFEDFMRIKNDKTR